MSVSANAEQTLHEMQQQVRAQLAERIPEALKTFKFGELSFDMSLEDITQKLTSEGFKHKKSSNRHTFEKTWSEGEYTAGHRYIVRTRQDKPFSIEFSDKKSVGVSTEKRDWEEHAYADTMKMYMETLCTDLTPSPTENFMNVSCPVYSDIEEGSDPAIIIRDLMVEKDGYVFRAKLSGLNYGWSYEVEATHVER